MRIKAKAFHLVFLAINIHFNYKSVKCFYTI